MALNLDRSAEHCECFIDLAHRSSATDAWQEGVCMSISELQTHGLTPSTQLQTMKSDQFESWFWEILGEFQRVLIFCRR